MDEQPAEHEARGVSPTFVTEPWPELRDAQKAVHPEHVTGLRDLLTKNGLFQSFIDELATLIHESQCIVLHIESDADEQPIEPAALQAAESQVIRDLCARLLEGTTDEAFRTRFTHDALAHAAAWAMTELQRTVPREQLLAMDEEAFAEAYNRIYSSKDYLRQALDGLLPAYMEVKGRALLEALEANVEEPKFNKWLEAAFHQAMQEFASARLTGTMPRIIEDGHIQFNATQIAFALVKAVENAGSGKGWDDLDRQRAPTYTAHTGIKSKNPGRIYVTIRNKQEDLAPDTATLDSLWATLGKMDDLTSDVLLVCLAICTKEGGAGWFNVDTFLDTRGIKRIQKQTEPGNWQHGHRTADRVAVGRALEQLEPIWIEVENVELVSAGKRRKPQRFTYESRVLAVIDRVMQNDLDGGKVVRAARVVLGSWIDTYRNAGITQIGILAQKALAYDPHNHQPEKRLAKYLAFHYRYNANRSVIRRRVRDLLETANIPADVTRPKRADDRLNKTLNCLQEGGVIGKWRPILNPAERPARNWFVPWLESMIEIEQPAFIQKRYAKIRD